MMPAHLATIESVIATARADDWRTKASCGDSSVDPEWWFSTKAADRDLAKRICEDCPVKTQCADYTKQTRPTHGIWAGELLDDSTHNLTPEQRSIYRTLREAATIAVASSALGISRAALAYRVKHGPAALQRAFKELKERGKPHPKTGRSLTRDETQERIAIMTAALTRVEAARALGTDAEYLTQWIRKNGTKQEIADWRALPIKETKYV